MEREQGVGRERVGKEVRGMDEVGGIGEEEGVAKE